MARSLKMLSNQYRSNSTKLGPFCDLPVFFGIEWRSGVPTTVWCTGTDQYLSSRADELERSGPLLADRSMSQLCWLSKSSFEPETRSCRYLLQRQCPLLVDQELFSAGVGALPTAQLPSFSLAQQPYTQCPHHNLLHLMVTTQIPVLFRCLLPRFHREVAKFSFVFTSSIQHYSGELLTEIKRKGSHSVHILIQRQQISLIY